MGVRGVGEVYDMDGGVLEASPMEYSPRRKMYACPQPCVGGWGIGWVVHVRGGLWRAGKTGPI